MKRKEKVKMKSNGKQLKETEKPESVSLKLL